jgi:hypothetical protein
MPAFAGMTIMRSEVSSRTASWVDLLERVAHFQAQVSHLRQVETNPANYHAAVSGFLAEIDRMQLEVREYLSLHPTELTVTEDQA